MFWKEVTFLFMVISNAVTMMKIRNIATLNVRGIGKDDDKFTLVEDAKKYKIDILTLSGTHIPDDECLHEIQSEKNSYVLYSCNEPGNHHHGVGFLIKKELEPNFKRITGRIAQATIQMKRRKIHIIAVYAPTLQTRERDTGKREELYEEIEATIDKTSKRDIVVVADDFNSKVGSQQQTDDKDCVGLYGKGKRHSSG